jgi:hypothetical protein
MKLRAVWVLAALLLVGGSASAQKTARDLEAKRHFEDGTNAFNLGDFPTAITEYKAAYKLKPEPVLLYNLGQACRLGNDLQQAIFFYRSYLRNSPNAANRREVEERIRKLEVQIAEQKSPPNHQLSPSGAPSGTGNEPPTTATMAPTAPRAPEPEAAPAPAPAATTPSGTTATELTGAPPAPRDRGRAPLYKKWWLWTAVGVVVLAGVGVGVGVALSESALPQTHFGTSKVFALRF